MHDEDGDQILFGDISVHWGCLKIHWAGILQHYMCSLLESGFLLFLLHWMVYNLKTHMMSLVLKIDLTSCSIKGQQGRHVPRLMKQRRIKTFRIILRCWKSKLFWQFQVKMRQILIYARQFSLEGSLTSQTCFWFSPDLYIDCKSPISSAKKFKGKNKYSPPISVKLL